MTSSIDERVAALVLLVILGVIASVAIAGRGTTPAITESADALSIRALGYEQQIAYRTIDSVTLQHGLSGLGAKRGALQSGNSYVGRFAMAPYGEAMLFVDGTKHPLVAVHSTAGVTIVSAADSAEAEQLAQRTRAAVARARGSGEAR